MSGRILLVDDNEGLLSALRRGIEEHGWEVELARTGLAALGAAKRGKPDVVVCDLHMPEMDGYQVLRAMKQIDALVPVIVHSGEDDLGAVLRAVREGAFDYVLKATQDIRPLLAAVDRAVAHARLARENQRLTLELGQRVKEIEQEREKSERLLLNVLPKPIAERLKNDDVIADHFPDVTVLFADLVGFTPLAANKTPGELILVLNEIFSMFDRLAERLGIEKIKTIGDAYMAAAGLPMPREDHAEACAEMALNMVAEIEGRKKRTGQALEIRIGIHTGPVVAGVIGESKFAYDLWGDTVNLASRMETQGVPGSVQVTAETAARLQAHYELESRGSVAIKGKGEMTTFLLRSRKRWTGAKRAPT